MAQQAHAPPGIDPRKIITPQSFHVAPHLMGLPLASPTRRLAAILLDLLCVSIVANVGGKILFALVTGAAFFWFAGKRLGNRGGFFSGSVRLAFRSFGALMLFVCALWAWQGARRTVDRVVDEDDDKPAVTTAGVSGGGAASDDPANVGRGIRTAIAVGSLQSVNDSASARRATEEAVKQLQRMGVSNTEIRTAMADAVKERPIAVRNGMRAALPPPETLPASARRDSASADSTAADSAGDDGEESDSAPANAAAKPDTVPTDPDSLAVAYAAAVSRGDTPRAEALRPKLASTLARDSLDELRERVGELRTENTSLTSEKEKLEKRGIIGTLLEWLDDLGIGFGWTALYFTFFTAMLKGQTPAKKLFGIRVLRLDGEPMTLWASFERYGGYAAGLFTGLTGYMQVYWDRNRQAVQDKISETVVIRDAGQPLPQAPIRPGPGASAPQGPYGPGSYGQMPYGQGPHGPDPAQPPAGVGTP